jgi:predicted RNA-binding Zn-ribbon protein involved in translation (DUF1610 family)
MRKLFVVIVALASLIGMAQAEGMGQMKKGMSGGKKMPKNYRMVPMAKAQILQEGSTKMFCPKCGMTLPMFYRTNHAAKVDGKMEQFCSMYCLIEEINGGKKVTDVQVVDNTTLKFIPAAKAFYVVGSSKPATMAKKVSKYAFGTEQAAKDFAAKFGGEVMRYDAALALAKKDFEGDTAAKKMRQVKAAKKGEMIYKKKCQSTDKKFATAGEAKAFVKANKLCGGLKGKPLQAVGLYLKSR